MEGRQPGRVGEESLVRKLPQGGGPHEKDESSVRVKAPAGVYGAGLSDCLREVALGEKGRRGKDLARKLERCGAGGRSKSTADMGGSSGEGYGTEALIWKGVWGAGVEDPQPREALLGRHGGQWPEENARVGGWELCQPGRRRGQAGSIPLGKNGQCVWVPRLPFLVPSLPEGDSRPQGLLSAADLYSMATDKDRVPASQVGFSLQLCWLGANQQSGAKPFP